MKAALFKGPWKIELGDVDTPKLIHPTDAIVDVKLASICGTDLHPYRGHIHNFRENTIMGHEFTGVVREVGSGITKFAPGDRVVVSDIIACGTCWFCEQGLHYQCSSASLFGYGNVVGEYTAGGQAETVRVPFADVVMFKIPDKLEDEEVLFVGDILSTGYSCIKKGALEEGESAIIIGGGPVGLMIAMCAQLYSPKDLYIIEPDSNRRRIAEDLGAIAISPDELDQIKGISEGRGPDIVFEAVGIEESLHMAFDLVRPGGRIVIAGSHKSEQFKLNLKESFAKEISFHFVVGNPIQHGLELIDHIQNNRLHPQRIISHKFPFGNIEEAYRLAHQQQAIKIILNM